VTARDPADELLDLFTLEELDANLYRASNPTQSTEYRPTLYGGQVAAQALLAAAHTVPEGRQPHSIHGYFLRAGRLARPTVMAVDRDSDGP
jgi:acyl-CoA thioesterase-2